MAYRFIATSKQAITSFAPISAVPATITAKVRSNVTDYDGAVVQIGQYSTNNRILIVINGNNYNLSAQMNGNSGGSVAALSGFVSSWANLLGTFSTVNIESFSNQARSNPVSHTLSVDPLLLMAIGARTTLDNYYSNAFIAEVAVWSVVLSYAEIISISKGFSPKRIRPQSLVFYAPLLRNLQDIKGSLALTNNNGATVADHPRVY